MVHTTMCIYHGVTHGYCSEMDGASHGMFHGGSHGLTQPRTQPKQTLTMNHYMCDVFHGQTVCVVSAMGQSVG